MLIELTKKQQEKLQAEQLEKRKKLLEVTQNIQRELSETDGLLEALKGLVEKPEPNDKDS